MNDVRKKMTEMKTDLHSMVSGEIIIIIINKLLIKSNLIVMRNSYKFTFENLIKGPKKIVSNFLVRLLYDGCF